MEQFASIFNDVLGPVMCGPSSSHTACSVRIGRLAREMAGGRPRRLLAEFDPKGSLAATYQSQGVDAGLAAGLLGMGTDDPQVLKAMELAARQGIALEFSIVPFPATHPNTYRLTVFDRAGEAVRFTVLSVGGGMLRLVELEGFPLDLEGGFYEYLLFFRLPPPERREAVRRETETALSCSGQWLEAGEEGLLRLYAQRPLKEEVLEQAAALVESRRQIRLSPVLPVPSQPQPQVPFSSMEEMLDARPGEPLWRIAMEYETARSGLTQEEVWSRMDQVLAVMERSVENGLAGTSYQPRILGCQSRLILAPENRGRMVPDPLGQRIIANISAVMETKSSMGVFVAAPTAGSCGCLPGTLLAVAQAIGAKREKVIQALFAAGAVGVLIARYATFAAEVAGCQAECGSGSGMTAAALVELMGGAAQEAADAASMALQNVFGMVCDPVAGGVEVPCLGKNIMCGLNALASANMALAGFDKVIPLDETIHAFNRVGRMLPCQLRCTGLDGLTITETSQRIQRNLKGGEPCCC